MGGSNSLPDTDAEFIVNYRCTGPVTGATMGEVVLTVDITTSEAVIKNTLSASLAAYLNPLVFPAQSYTASDVRGFNL
jgi:hypothetical protein